MSPGKMIQVLSGLRRKPGRGIPFLDLSPGDGGRESPVGCLLLLEVPAIRLAAKRLRRREGRCGGRTEVPGQLSASIEVPAIRLAAERLRRREGPSSNLPGCSRHGTPSFRPCRRLEMQYGNHYDKRTSPGADPRHRQERALQGGCLLLLRLPHGPAQ